jgi:hypothetical protein
MGAHLQALATIAVVAFVTAYIPDPQRLKPEPLQFLTARLKPRPFKTRVRSK